MTLGRFLSSTLLAVLLGYLYFGCMVLAIRGDADWLVLLLVVYPVAGLCVRIADRLLGETERRS